MKRTALLSLLFFVILGSSSAQNFVGKLNYHPEAGIKKAPETLRILAVMVEFQEDNYDGTFGTGKFGSIYTEDYGNDILDPLPHDAEYFENHLEFAKNYFRKVSNSQLTIDYRVLPDVITVSQAMRNYSPPLNSDSLNELGIFAEEVWQLTAQKYPDLNFSDYDLFAVFHAGVGRDINTPGSLGIERDLPSVYLGINTLQNIFGQNFKGFPANGATPITNTMVLPETESRELEGIGGTILLELTINGLIVASIASHLGLPDLFNTETGLSAIGRFGLMDGQSIFAYNGVFPPEPSPWEKMELGWIDPVVVDDPAKVDVAVNKNFGDTVLVKVPINSSEYYLIENRNRDTENNGAVVTYKLGNETFTETFTEDTTGFYSFDTDTLKGVITDVDEFDWALPGSGIVIWHIDLSIISDNRESNSINNDKFNRGVDVEEADGIQDIGEEFSTIFGETVIGEGTEEDFWFASNDAQLYQNKFTPSTKPNTNSNSGANSLVNITDFSDISNKMSFELIFADEQVRLRTFRKLSVDGSIKYFSSVDDGTENYLLFTTDENTLYLTDVEGDLIAATPNFSSKKPAVFKYKEQVFIVGVLDKRVWIWKNLISSNAEIEKITFELDSEISAQPVICEIGEDRRILLGTAGGVLYNISIKELLAGGDLSENFRTPVFNEPIVQLVSTHFPSDNLVAAISENEYWDNSGLKLNIPQKPLKMALTNDHRGEKVVVVLAEENTFYIIGENGIIKNFSLEGSPVTNFSLGKLNSDEEIYIAVSQDDKVKAVNLSGFPIDNFPFANEANPDFSGTPLSANISNSNLFAYSTEGDIYSFNYDAEISESFPLSAGSSLSAVPALFLDTGKHDAISDRTFSLAAVTYENNLFVWNIAATTGLIFWGEEYANSYNNSYLEGPVRSETAEYFPEERAYNWPNPVFEDETYIRYFVSEDSDVEVKIFDLSGELIAELTQKARGGLDNEITWNVNDVPSGVYFAHINLNSNAGNADSKIIKIAVIK